MVRQPEALSLQGLNQARMRLVGASLCAVLLFACLTGCSRPQQAQTAASPAPSAAVLSTAAATAGVTVAFTDISGSFAEPSIKDEAALGVFDQTSGTFNPNASISRADFVRWLVKADNAYFASDAQHQIRLAEGTTNTFVDVPSSDANYKYIQALANAGYVIGKNKTHFAPAQPITREETIAIKAQVDEGSTIPSDPGLVQFLPFSDKSTINPQFLGAVHEDFSVRTTQNISRVWGSIKVFHPRQPLTRSEAAIALAEIASGSAAVALGRTAPPAPH